MANRYAVATGGWTNVNTWSDTTGGAPPASSVPGVGDVALFDAASGVINVTVDGATTVSQINGTGYAGTLTVANALTVSAGLVAMAGSLVLDADCTISDTTSGITATVTGAADLTCNGLFEIDAAADFSGHTGIVQVAGASSADFTPGCALGAVEIKKTAGNAQLGAGLTCSSLTVTSGTLVNNGQAVDVAGNITFTAGAADIAAAWTCGGNLSIAAGFNVWQRGGSLTFDAAAGDLTITTNEVRLPAIIVDNAGVDSFVLQDDLICDGFTLTDGKFDANGNDVTAYGHLVRTAGTLAGTGSKWTQAATGNVKNTSSGDRFAHVELGTTAGVTSTLTDSVYASQVTLGPGTTTGAKTLYFVPSGNGLWSQNADATFSVATLVVNLGASCNIGRVDFSAVTNGITVYAVTTDKTATAIGDWVGGAKDVKMYNETDTKYAGLAMGAYSLDCRDVLPGSTVGSKGGGRIGFGSGNHSFRNMNVQAGGDAGEDLADFGTSNILLSGTIDCTGIDTLQNTGGVVIGGTIDETDLTGQTALLHLYPAAAGTNNTNVTELSPPIGGAIPGRSGNSRQFRGR